MHRILLAAAVWLLAGCASPPDGPTAEQQAEATAWAQEARWVIGSSYALRREPGGEYPHRLARTVVRFSVHRSGRIADPSVATSSGYPAVDEAAVRAVRSAPALPRPPAWIFERRSPSDSAMAPSRDTVTMRLPVSLRMF